MQYLVLGEDGKEYGPADIDKLKAWVTENRLRPNTVLRDSLTGKTLTAGTLPELFGPQQIPPTIPPSSPYSVPPSNYPRATANGSTEGSGELVGALFRCGLALVSFFLIGGLGFIFAGYALMYAIQCRQKGHKYGNVAVIISGATLAIILAGWSFRMKQ